MPYVDRIEAGFQPELMYDTGFIDYTNKWHIKGSRDPFGVFSDGDGGEWYDEDDGAEGRPKYMPSWVIPLTRANQEQHVVWLYDVRKGARLCSGIKVLSYG